MKKSTFVFSLNWYEVLKDYPGEVRLEVYEAIIRYASSGTLSELKPLAKMAFQFIQREMDYNQERYEATVEQRSESGRRGGAPAGNQNARKQLKQAKQAKQANGCFGCFSETTSIQPKQLKQLKQPKQAKQAKQADIDNDNDNDIKEKNNIKKESDILFSELSESESDIEACEAAFEAFRQRYPGKRRGFAVEFEHLQQRYPDTWREIIPLLGPAVDRLLEWNRQAKAAGMFVPCHKDLSTWINMQSWTDEYPPIVSPSGGVLTVDPSEKARRKAEQRAEEERQEAEVRQQAQRRQRRLEQAAAAGVELSFTDYISRGCGSMSDDEFGRFMLTLPKKRV